jgi:dihydroxyacetone kinase-like protein
MSTTFNRDFFTNVFRDMEQLAEEQRDHFVALDSAIGDGDHGVNLVIGFREVGKQLDTINAESEDIANVFKKVGNVILRKVGGSAGPLYGSLLIDAGKVAADKNEVSFSELCDMLIAGTNAVQKRGKAVVGDKTMIDALLPGIEYLDGAKDGDPIEVFDKFVSIMREGAETTIPIIAKKGRAMRLGERAIGHKDPGAESSWMLMNIFNQNIKKVVG